MVSAENHRMREDTGHREITSAIPWLFFALSYGISCSLCGLALFPAPLARQPPTVGLPTSLPLARSSPPALARKQAGAATLCPSCYAACPRCAPPSCSARSGPSGTHRSSSSRTPYNITSPQPPAPFYSAAFCLSWTMLFTRLHFSSGGSLSMAILFHGTGDFTSVFLQPFESLTTFAALTSLMALASAAFRKSSPTPQPPPSSLPA